MKKSVGIAVVVGIAIVIGAIGFQMYDSSYERTTAEEFYEREGDSEKTGVKNVVYPENPQTLYGLTINKDKYLLGEKVFMSINNIPMGLKDSVQFFTPEGKLYLDLQFDGNEKSGFKHYFKPSLMKALPWDRAANLCDKEDLIGKWTVMFRGLPDDKLYFEVLEETLPYSEDYFIGCNENPIEIPIMEPSLGK